MPILYNPAPIASSTVSGYMTSADKSKLDGIASEANKYILPTAASSTLGGIQVGYTTSNQNYAVQVDSNGNAYVSVPQIDTLNSNITSINNQIGNLQSYRDGTTVITSLSDIPVNFIGFIRLGAEISPEGTITSYCAMCSGNSTNNRQITLLYSYNGKQYTNTCNSGTWTGWVCLSDQITNVIANTLNNSSAFDGNVNDLPIGWVYAKSSATNLPNANAYFIQTMKYSTNAMQIAVRKDNSYTFVRTNDNGTWKEWKRIDDQIANIGTIIEGTNETSLSVPSSTYTKVSSVTLSAGTYIVKAHTAWEESFSDGTVLRLLRGTTILPEATIRSNGASGGGDITEAFIKLNASATINFEVRQSTSTTKTAQNVVLKAIRII